MPEESPKRLFNRYPSLMRHFIAVVANFIGKPFMSGLVLLVAAVTAMIMANSSYSTLYTNFWQQSFCVQLGTFSFCQSVHFFVNDILMTLFFLVVGVEIRCEIHSGVLSNIKQASLPVVAAIGGVCCPAIIYLLFNHTGVSFRGWAVPTATDIAFAIGILSLLGSAIPTNLRVILLALAVIDDIIAVLIIAFFYSSDLNFSGALISAAGFGCLFFFYRQKKFSVPVYGVAGVVIWLGLYIFGVHPSLAGIVLGLMIPVEGFRTKRTKRVNLHDEKIDFNARPDELKPVRQNDILKTEILVDLSVPVLWIQKKLSPCVSYLIMPLFAFANAGVHFNGVDFSDTISLKIMAGIFVGLFIGKPLGIVLVSEIFILLKLCRLPDNVSLAGLVLIGCLGGVGFTMALFTAMLAFPDAHSLAAAKIGVLCGSLLSALGGITYGTMFLLLKKNCK